MSVADITVVVPYYNEAKCIRTTLNLLKAQTLAPREIFLVNSSSTDESSRIVDDWVAHEASGSATRYRNIFENTNTPASSKNVGVRRSSGRLIAFMDCGLIFPANWLERQYEYLTTHPGDDWVSGVGHFEGVNFFDKCAVAQTYGYGRSRPTIPSSLLKRELFARFGLFLENRRAGYDVAWRLLLEKNGISRGINPDVQIRYEGVNFARSLSAILRKSILYSAPMVTMTVYRRPLWFLFFTGAAFLSLLVLNGRVALIVFLLYMLVRGLLVPVVKSRNYGILKQGPLYWAGLPLVGLVMDVGKIIGIIKGFYQLSRK